MTISTNDVMIATTHEVRGLEWNEAPIPAKARRVISWADVGISLVFLWLPLLLGASGLGLLLEAILDTVRYGHPR